MMYDIAFLIFSLFYLPALIFKGKLHGDFLERFGVYAKEKQSALEAAGGAIWIQAVSVGEVALCRELVPLIRERFPGKAIVFSTITKTGNDLARKLFAKDAVIIYFPLDFSFIVRKIVRLVKPDIYVMVETEIWPNIIRELSAGKIPSILINGRISDRSYGRYILARPFFRRTLGRISLFCAQSGLDADRIISIGAPKERVRVTGNMKFDAEVRNDARAAETLREALSLKADEELFVAGSTHRGEEKIIIDSYNELLADFPGLRLLIAPRHIERSSEVKALVNELRTTKDERRIIVLDKIGYLTSAYPFATLVFIGGSLVRHGGQNPIEAAIFEKAVIFGPHMFNFREISSSLLKSGGAVQVRDKKELVAKARLLLKDKAARDELGRNAKRAVIADRGATDRNLSSIAEILK